MEIEIIKNYLDVESCLELASAARILKCLFFKFYNFIWIIVEILNCTRLFKASVRTIANNINDLCQTKEFLDANAEIKSEVFKIHVK